MKLNSKLASRKVKNAQEAFEDLLKSLRPTLTLWDYFVDWHSVIETHKPLAKEFEKWDSLVGTKNFEKDFLSLLTQNPDLVRTLPYLVVRNGDKENKKDLMLFSITTDLRNIQKPDIKFDFNKPASLPELRTAALLFAVNTGLADMFINKRIKSTSDYAFGIEAGLNSNGRKNRSGKAMEQVVGTYLQKYCSKNNLRFIPQANPARIELELGFSVKLDKSSRNFDFAISDGKKLVLIEVNFYNGGGSKLKSTAGEFRKLDGTLKKQGISLVWITDGAGWGTTAAPLQDAFNEMDYVWNLNWLNAGFLDDLFK